MKRLVSLLVAVVFGFNSVFGWSAPIGMSMVNVLAGGKLNSALPLPVAKGFEIVNGSMVFTWDKDEVAVGKDEFLKAFFTALQLKDKHFWVDMGMLKSVYEVLDPALVGTIIGRVFIESDIELKKKAMEMLRDVEIEGEDLGMFRLWIVPDKAEVLEKKDGMGVEIKNLRLKVKAEIVRGMGDEMRRYIEGEMVKKLTREVNEGKEFEALRKVFGAIVLARWYKERAREGWPYYEIAGRDVMNDSLREDNWSVREYLKEYGRIVIGTIEANDVPFVGGGVCGWQGQIEVSGKEKNIDGKKDRLQKKDLKRQLEGELEAERGWPYSYSSSYSLIWKNDWKKPLVGRPKEKDLNNDTTEKNKKGENGKKFLIALLTLVPMTAMFVLFPSLSMAAGWSEGMIPQGDVFSIGLPLLSIALGGLGLFFCAKMDKEIREFEAVYDLHPIVEEVISWSLGKKLITEKEAKEIFTRMKKYLVSADYSKAFMVEACKLYHYLKERQTSIEEVLDKMLESNEKLQRFSDLLGLSEKIKDKEVDKIELKERIKQEVKQKMEKAIRMYYKNTFDDKFKKRLYSLSSIMDDIIYWAGGNIITLEEAKRISDGIINQSKRDPILAFSAKAYYLHSHPQFGSKTLETMLKLSDNEQLRAFARLLELELDEDLKDVEKLRRNVQEEIERRIEEAAWYYDLEYEQKGKGIFNNNFRKESLNPGGIDLRAVVLTPVNYSPAGVGI